MHMYRGFAYDQLKIENQTLIEKIEERSEELAKLKRKKMLTVQILTHIRLVQEEAAGSLRAIFPYNICMYVCF